MTDLREQINIAKQLMNRDGIVEYNGMNWNVSMYMYHAPHVGEDVSNDVILQLVKPETGEEKEVVLSKVTILN